MKNIWKRFFSLTEGQDFYIRRNKLAVKVGFCSYQEHAEEAKTAGQWGKQTPTCRISPWRRVRTTQPIKAGNYPIKVAATQTARITASDCYNPDYATGRESTASEKLTTREILDSANAGSYRTHYVGDDCPGGHRIPAAEQIQVNAGCAIIHEVARELTASEVQDRENTNRMLAEANAQPCEWCECEIYQTCARCSPRDPMAQDHSPDKPSVAPTDRNGPSS